MGQEQVRIMPATGNKKSWVVEGNISAVFNELPSRIQNTYSPKFDVAKGRFILEGISDEELQKIVDTLSLTNDKGDVIKKANPYNINDAFFNHKSVRVTLTKNAKIFDLSSPMQKLHLGILRTYNILAKSKSEVTTSTKWYIDDPEKEATKIINKASKAKLSLELYNKLTSKQKRYVLAAISAQYPLLVKSRITRDTGTDLIEALLFEIATNTTQDVRGVSPSDTFVEIASMGGEELNVRALIGRSLHEGVVRKKGDKFYYKEEEIATDYHSLLKALKDPTKQATYEAIEREVSLIDKSK